MPFYRAAFKLIVIFSLATPWVLADVRLGRPLSPVASRCFVETALACPSIHTTQFVLGREINAGIISSEVPTNGSHWRKYGDPPITGASAVAFIGPVSSITSWLAQEFVSYVNEQRGDNRFSVVGVSRLVKQAGKWRHHQEVKNSNKKSKSPQTRPLSENPGSLLNDYLRQQGIIHPAFVGYPVTEEDWFAIACGKLHSLDPTALKVEALIVVEGGVDLALAEIYNALLKGPPQSTLQRQAKTYGEVTGPWVVQLAKRLPRMVYEVSVLKSGLPREPERFQAEYITRAFDIIFNRDQSMGQRARKLLAQGYLKAAVELLKSELVLKPGSASLKLLLASVFYRMGDFRSTIEMAFAVLDQDPVNDRALLRARAALGNLKASEASVLKGELERREALAASKMFAKYLNEARLEIENRGFEVAVETLRAAIDLDSLTAGQKAVAYSRMAEAYQHMEQFDQAIRAAASAVESTPLDARAWFGLSAAYQAADLSPIARKTFLKALQVSVGRPEILLKSA